MIPEVLSVTALNTYIKKILESDFLLRSVKVAGEISNFKNHSSGHLYFTLKDAGARINCVMFRGMRQKLKKLPKDGDQVTLSGRVSAYVPGGAYQIYVEDIEEEGQGDLYAKFLDLKERLSREGLFDPANRRPIPKHPRTIAVITSPTGAAIRDIIKVLRTRNPAQELLIYPVQVQGDVSEAQVIDALERVNERQEVQVVILARGGGSIEDLWGFNSEAMARAIRASRIPVVTGIGHDIDFTIADFAADLRAATPSQAAELTIAQTSDGLARIEEARRQLDRGIKTRLRQEKTHAAMLARMVTQNDPRLVIVNHYASLSEAKERLDQLTGHRLELNRQRLLRARDLLRAYNPYHLLDQGYAIIKNEHGELIRGVSALHKAKVLTIRLKDGETTLIPK
ncbi:Exodeoxyribonuclease VII large subunit [Clostridiaceae bacterium JG1575]|nr:Exodeoxyribonuclease VII large subunit [Clostridiaceae bacterium JG1575]